MQTLRDRALTLRDRIVSNLDFQRRIAGFPGGRHIARRQARLAFELCAGFVHSQILLACTELGIFEIVRTEPRTAKSIASRTNLSLEAAEKLLEAATALKLLSRRSGGRYGLGLLGAAIGANPGIIAMIEHHRMFYEDLQDPVGLLRGEISNTRLNAFWLYAKGDEKRLSNGDVADYSRLMSASQSLVADQVFAAYPLDSHRTLLDIGGGNGEFVLRAAARYPSLNFLHFDLPAVSDLAKLRFDEARLVGRAQTFGGSFLSDDLPGGADVATLNRVVHDHEDDAVCKLFAAAHKALAPGGTLLIAEPLSGTPGAEAVSDAYFAFYLLAMGRGRPRSASELKALLHNAGFSSVREAPTHLPLQLRVLAARK